MISLVPDQTPEDVDKLVRDFLEAEFALLGTKCKMEFEVMSSGKPWVADTDHWNYKAAINATQVSEKKTTFVHFPSHFLKCGSRKPFPSIL